MASKYAGVLGALGMAVALLRGAIDAAGLEGTSQLAIQSLLLLAPVGYVVGAIAESTVDESVRQRLESQLASLNLTDNEDETQA